MMAIENKMHESNLLEARDMARSMNSHSKARSLPVGFFLFLAAFQLSSATSSAQIIYKESLLQRFASTSSVNLRVSFTYSPKFATAGQIVQFRDSSSGNPASLIWDFGDGTTSAERNPAHVFTSPGFRKITLVASTGAATKRASRTIIVMPATNGATFVFSPSTPGPGQTVQFADTTSGTPSSWRWDFGDGTTSLTKNPSHAFSREGRYTVTLVANDTSGSKQGSQILAVVSMSVLTSSFNYAPSSPTTAQAVQFTDTSTGSPTSWLWNFGDGATSTAQNPTHAYSTAGSKTVTLTASNSTGSASFSRTVSVLVAIAASFSFSPSSPIAGQAVQFTDSSTGVPSLWQWSFGDGGTSTAQNPSHTFVTAGTYGVTLTIMNATGQDAISRSITVLAANTVTASFAYSPASPTAGQAVQFTDTSAGTPTTWLWNFDDETTSTAQNPNHAFATAGTYSVSLTVSNASGSNSINRTVVIASPSLPVAGFSFSPSNPVLGQTVQFSDASTGSPTSWQWSFGDGASSTVQNPAYTYSHSGTQTVTLTIRAGSNSDSTTKPITIGTSNVITAASPSYSDVAAAIAAASAGDTVIVPAGSATWSSHLVITKPISLIGAGQGQTNITSSYAGSGGTGSADNWLISYVPSSPANDGAFRLSGFSINCANLCGALGLFNTSVAYPQTKVRIDHMTTTNARNSCIVYGPIYGVMDNCNLSQSAGVFFNFLFYSLDTIWTNHTFKLGTPNNFYVEDCILNCGLSDGGCTNGGFGQRYVIRHSTINAQGHLMSCWDAHGNMGPGNGWSTQGIELYENTINAGNFMVIVFDHRGGRAAVWGNSLYNTVSAGYQIREEYYDSGNPPAVAPDGQPQYPSGSYYWLNRKNGTTVQSPGVEHTLDYPGLPGVPAENREFWIEKTSFNGSAGVGVGVLSARPLTGAVGVGYWASDVKILYTWTSNNRWEEHYVPYAYPHPLRTTLSQ